MSYLFVFRFSPDVDHMVPLAWKLLEEGEEVHAVLSPGYDPEPDYRIGLLRRYPRFQLHEAWPPAAGGSRLTRVLRGIAGYARCTLPFALALLASKRVRLVVVDWGNGLPTRYDRLRSLTGIEAILRSLGRSLVMARRDRSQVRANFIVAARLLGVPTVCLPHGLSIKLDAAPNEEIAAQLENGSLEWADRNRFAAFVLNTEHHRRWQIEHAKGDSRVMQTWGSLRWAPEWFELNRQLAPPFAWPEEAAGRVKVVFMVPKWGNRIHPEKVFDLIKRLQALEHVSLAVMGHPRPEQGGSNPLHTHPDVDTDRLLDVSGASSVSVIRESDVVIDIGSSIEIEVLMQGKVLVNPSYMHDVTTIFDKIEGMSVVARSAEDIVEYLHAHAEGSPLVVEEAAYEELMRHVVYGSRSAAFDVVEHYYQRIAELAANGGSA